MYSTKINKKNFLRVLIFLLIIFRCNASSVKIQDLSCEYLLNPLGIDEKAPRLSWKLVSSERCQRQTAYRILVAGSTDQLDKNEGVLWDTGKTESEQNLHIRYSGKPLVSGQQCFWKIKVWDQDGRVSGWSPTASWEIGLPEPNDWQETSWIRLPEDTRNSPLAKRSIHTRFMAQSRSAKSFPSPLFRKEFSISSDIIRARAYVCGLGYHEVYINGKRCGDAVLEPGQTSFDVRGFYITYDISDLLQRGDNAIGIMLGNGFFGQNLAFNSPRLSYGPPVLRTKIIIDYANGSTQIVSTDESWKCQTGPIIFDNIYGGETYDARLEKKGWQTPGYDDTDWKFSTRASMPKTRLQAQMIPPIRMIKTLKPIQQWKGDDGKWFFDLGQNISGFARIRINAPAGTQLTLKYAEILSESKKLNPITTGVHATGMEQTDIYICKGKGLETWSPRFTYHGFRYVEVDGLASTPSADFLEGIMVRSSVQPRGSFECSDDLLNNIYRTSLWTIEDNLHSILEDCPHREKCAWLGDTHAAGETAIYNFDMAAFFTKFADDIETVLGRGGITYWKKKASPGIPCNVAVGKRLCQEARPDWGAAYILVPGYLYTYYGDRDIFTRHYDHLKRWIEYVCNLRENGIVVKGYGDWCPPGGNNNMECPVPLSSTAFFYSTLRVMEDFAETLNKRNDVELYRKLAEETKEAFNQKFFNFQTGGYGCQTADALALRFNLQPKGQKSRVVQSLRYGVQTQHQGHAFTGIHGSRPLYTVLCENDLEEIAVNAMKNKTWPSLAYALANGMTTWPEIFDQFDREDDTSGRSLNHPMQSGFAAWFHECIGGIKPAAPGFKQISLKPYGYTKLTWAKVQHDCPYGMIKSHWHCENNRFQWQVTIPQNTTAIIHVPYQSKETVTENGKPLEECTGVKFLRFEDKRAVYKISSGSYDIQAVIPPDPV